MNIGEKKKIVEDFHEKFLKSKVVIVTDYKGLDVMTTNKLRRKLKESEVEYKVVKNTLLVKASEGTDVALIKESFIGPSSVAFSYTDPVAPAKVLTKFADEHDSLKIKVGVMDGKALDLSEIKRLASLPSREELLSQFLSALNGIPTSFVRVLSDIPRKFLNLLNAINERKSDK